MEKQDRSKLYKEYHLLIFLWYVYADILENTIYVFYNYYFIARRLPATTYGIQNPCTVLWKLTLAYIVLYIATLHMNSINVFQRYSIPLQSYKAISTELIKKVLELFHQNCLMVSTSINIGFFHFYGFLYTICSKPIFIDSHIISTIQNQVVLKKNKNFISMSS